MSKQALVDFMKKLQQDGELQEELRAQLGDPEQGIATSDLAQFAAGKGYSFDITEVQEELSDEQLDAVAGGLFDVFCKLDPIGSIGVVRFAKLSDKTSPLIPKVY
jgi:predicted ribosomally synthesized peptide with nif11-like leader